MSLHAIILAGGRGERFWPLSRRTRPKQTLTLLGEESLLAGTLRRVASEVSPRDTWIIAGADQEEAITGLDLDFAADRILWEPVGRNTAPAIGAAAELVLSETRPGGEEEPTLLILPSDHWIADTAEFWRTIRRGKRLADAYGHLVTFGIPVTRPETGYGYIERGDPIDPDAHTFHVSRFHEKPTHELAETYLRSGGYYWNSGIFLFRARGIAEMLRRHVPDLAPPLDRLREDLQLGVTPEAWKRYFNDAPSISIDYGVMERADSVAVVEAMFDWSDLGSWTSWADFQERDEKGNRVHGNALLIDAHRNTVYSQGPGLTALLGVKGLIVVRVGDATLVCAGDRAQEIRRLVEEGRTDELQKYF